MAVWAVTIPAFWYVTLHNLRTSAERPGKAGAIASTLRRNHGIVLTVWMLGIVALVFERFWAPWESVFV